MKSLRLPAVAIAAALVAPAAFAQDADVGQGLYMQYCATCHGADGTGQGPLTEVMTVNVPDLTRLAADNEGDFPMLHVVHIIDGRTGLRAHGGPMPVYGQVFDTGAEGPMSFGSVLETRGRILSLALYLESIQG